MSCAVGSKTNDFVSVTMPASTDAILDQSLECLSWHFHPEWGDQSPLDVFNRLLAKSIEPAGWTHNTHLDIQRHQITSRREQWTTETLGRLVRGHGSSAGGDFGCPIIVAEYEGQQRLLDGNHRINRWIAVGDMRVHDVNIHTVIGTASFIAAPSAGHSS
jgi:hypothetical protein